MHDGRQGLRLGKLGSALADARHRARAPAVLGGGARALVLAVVGLLVVLLASAQGADGTFTRTWGKDVGGPGAAVCTVAANCQAGTQGGLGGEFNSPAWVATDAAGNVYVADTFNERIQKFDSSGSFLRAWGRNVGGPGVEICTVAANCQAGTQGGLGGEFSANGPDGVATDAAGNVYVTEFYGNRVQKFDSSGTFLLAWGKDVGGAGAHTCTVAASCAAGATGGAGGEFSGPQSVATDSAGNVYVADSNNSRVQKFDSSGTFQLAWGKDVGGAGVAICTVAASCRAGTRDVRGDAFSNPTGVGTDATGSVYITDQNLFRVQKFDSSGTFLRAWGKDVGGAGVEMCTVAANCQGGSSGVQGGEFNANGPAGVSTDQAGNLYVANAAAGGRIQEFDSSGAFLRAWGKDVGGAGVPICTVAANCQGGAAGGLGGEFRSPVGVATDSTGGLYVADNGNRRIQKFAASAPMWTLTVSTSGSGAQSANGARAVVTGPGIDCSTGDQFQHNRCSTTVADGMQITLTATPAQGGGAFTGFTGGGCGATSPCTVTMNADQSVDARFAGPPSAIVATPPDGGTYAPGAVVNASYSCSPGADGGVLKSGTAGCSGPVPNGSPIDTAAVGAHTFTVTATDTDGQSASTTSHYTVTAPGPPSATITTPADGASYSFAANVNASYSCSAGSNGGVLKPGAAGCSGSVPNGSPIDTTTSGTHTFSLTATDTDGQSSTTTTHYTLDYTVGIPTPVRPKPPTHALILHPQVDIRVTGIEVTQGIQDIKCNCAGTLPERLDPFAKSPGRAAYEGVTMAAGKYTVVRVYAHFTNVDPGASSLPGATATLRIFDSHEREISPPLSPDISPAALSRPDCVACVRGGERADARAAFTFLVPWQDTYHRSLSLRATVSPPVGFSAPVQCGGCNANVFTLRGVPFATTATLPIYPIPLTVGGVQTSKSEDQVFDSTQTVLPVNVEIHPYDAPLAIDGLNATQAAAAVDLRALDDLRVNSQYPVGVFIGGGLSGSGGQTIRGRYLYGAGNSFHRLLGLDPPISIVTDDRPLTSVMHEIGHGLGLVHADTGSGPGGTGQHPDGTPDCTGNSGGQVGEAWPPDNEGRIQGIGFDLRAWSARILEEHYPKLVSKYYDFMSYCPGTGSGIPGTVQQFEDDHWISVRNWSRLIAFHPPAQALPATIDARSAGVRAAGDTTLRVIATVDAAGQTSIFDLAPGKQTFAGSPAGSPYRLELRDAAGATLASVIPATTSVHNDGGRPGLVLEATLPFVPSAAAVVVSAGGIELTERTRSAHAPTAAIISPRPGTRIGRSTWTLVRWSAHDRDSDRLTTTVDYSADGGRHWKVVASAASGGSARVPSRLLNASRNARLRVRVSDGFNVATATSGLLRAAGARPIVHIIGGSPGGRMRADATLLLRGAAYDDAGRQLTGRSLRWYAGRRLLGRGELLTVPGLPAGTTAIRLVATDLHGRSSQARLPMRVLAVAPTFLVARAPGHVAPGARRVRVVVASTVPATLTIGGRRYAVNRKPRTITISIKRGRSILRLAYVLSARGGATHGTYLAAR